MIGGLVGLSKPTQVRDWHSDPSYRAECLKALRWNFDYIIVDCPSLDVSSDATLLAPMIDGVAIVVQAGRTRRAQIQRARQTVENVGGEFLGFVLNQRRYAVPNWLYQRL
jgi:Mrp family chromosome partitioning ATPase